MQKMILTLFFFLCLTMHVGCHRSEADWFVPERGQVVLVRTEIAPRGEQQLDIKSLKPLQLDIETDASYELTEKYSVATPLPVQLKHRKTFESISTVKGAGGVLFQPVDGNIPLTLKNGTDVVLRVVICSEPID